MDSELTPHIYMTQLPGIPGIDGLTLCYGSWHLLNEALACFMNNEHYACIACLAASIELWLRRTLNSTRDFRALIRQAKKAKIISPKEAEQLDELRNTRNMYIHFNQAKLPQIKSAKTVRLKDRKMAFSEIDRLIELSGEEVNPYPTDAHKDAFPLACLAFLSYLYLNNVIKFFLKRYSRKDSLVDSYYKFIIQGIEGVDDSKLVIHLKTNKKEEVSRLNQILALLRKMFNIK